MTTTSGTSRGVGGTGGGRRAGASRAGVVEELDRYAYLRALHLQGRLVSSIVMAIVSGLLLSIFWFIDRDATRRLLTGNDWPGTSWTFAGLAIGWLGLVALTAVRCVEVLRMIPAAPVWLRVVSPSVILVALGAVSALAVNGLRHVWGCAGPGCALSPSVWPWVWLALVAVVLLLPTALLWPVYRELRRIQEVTDAGRQQDGAGTPEDSAQPCGFPEKTGPEPSAEEPSARPPVVIACSGGGIRSASFCLGALQRLALTDDYRKAKWLVGVSGGGYIAAAWATLGRYRSPSQPGGVDPDHPFMLGSPELARLRRNTRYLDSSLTVAYQAVVSLLWGIAISTILFGAGLATLGWLLGWQMTITGLGTFSTSDGRLHLALHYGLAWWWLVPLTAAVATFVGTVVADKFRVDNLRRAEKVARIPSGIRLWSARAGSTTAVAGLVFGLLMPGVPLTAAALHNTTVSSSSPTLLADGLYLLGFASEKDCDQAVDADWPPMWTQEARSASLLRAPVTFTFGNCGRVLEATVVPQDADGRGAPPLPKPLPAAAGGISTASTGVGALGAIAASLIGLLRSTRKTGSARHAEPTLVDKGLDLFRRAVAPWLANALFVAALYGVLVWVTLSFARRPLTSDVPMVTKGLLAATVVIWLVTDANLTSLLRFYRRRLSFAYLMQRNSNGSVSPLPGLGVPRLSQLTGDGPRLVLTGTANVSTQDVVPAGRGGTPFVFAEDGIGFTDPRLPGGDRRLRPKDYEGTAGITMNVATAMAISGSAVSALAGRGNRTVEPFRLLMTFFNIRTGAWIRNPYWVPSHTPDRKLQWLWRQAHKLQASPFLVLHEALGNASLGSRYVFVSDGGHFDNLGLVEALRRRPEKIILLDGTQEPRDSFIGLGESLSTARTDMLMEAHGLDLSAMSAGRKKYPQRAWTTFTMRPVEKAGPWAGNNGSECEVVYIKALLLEDAPADLHSYKKEHDVFPTTPTFSQLYDEFDFEAYRELGYSVTDGYVKQREQPNSHSKWRAARDRAGLLGIFPNGQSKARL